jgi:glycosyltransferase involved in cell wall biosynthesis
MTALNEKPEILFVWNYKEWGGVQIYLLGIMRYALRSGYRVKVLLPAGTSDNLLAYYRQENIPVEFFPANIDLSPAKNVWHKVRRRWRDLRTTLILFRTLTQQKSFPQIIQADLAVWANFWLLLYLSLKTHVFITMHIATPFNPKSPRDFLTKIKYRLLCRLPNFHLMTSNGDMKNSLKPFLNENYWQKIPIAYTGVNSSEIRNILVVSFNRAEMLLKYDLPTDKILVFSLANIIERKGFRVWLKAAARLRADREDLFFVWIGDGECYAEMEGMIAESGLQKSVKIIRPSQFAGERKELLQLLRIGDIFAHPSYAEGLPGALLEAMALGKPVVASKVNAIPECVIDGTNGFLAEAGNDTDLAKLADNKTLRETLGEAAHQQVLSNFTEERCAEVTIAFYEKLLAGEAQDYLIGEQALSKEVK